MFPVHQPTAWSEGVGAPPLEFADADTALPHTRVGPDDGVALKLVEELAARGFIQRYESLAECQPHLLHPPVVSKFLVVTTGPTALWFRR